MASLARLISTHNLMSSFALGTITTGFTGGAPVYLYNFGYKSEVLVPGTDYPVGTPHAMDISFKFNNEVPPKDGTNGHSHFGGSKPERFIASKHFAGLWTGFARTGHPAAKDVPEWPAYNLDTRPPCGSTPTARLLTTGTPKS